MAGLVEAGHCAGVNVNPELIGVAGVTLLLIGFAGNILRRLDEQGAAYLLMNLFGAGLAACYAWQTNSIPFVVLETVWAAAALGRLISPKRRRASRQGRPS